MNVPVLLKVPVERAIGLAAKVEGLKAYVKKRRTIDTELWRKINMPNLLRVALLVGFPRLDRMNNDQLLSALQRDGLARGRPRGR